MEFQAPKVVEYVPGMQAVHWLAFQAPAVVEYVPVSHSRHTVAPFVGEYLPVEQLVQIPIAPIP